MDAMELSLDDTGAAEPSKPDAPAAPTGRRATLSNGSEITEGHVNRVAAKLREAGAAAFFHVDGQADFGDASEADPIARTVDLDSDPEVESVVITLPAPEPFASDTATSRIEELERAAEDGRVDELLDLLDFEPSNDAERFAQAYYQAEYQLLANRPLQALKLFAALDTPSLSDEQKRRVWFKTAACQRSIHDFAAAKQTLERLVRAFPGVAAYERLSQRNHEQYLNEQGNNAPMLEKTTSLE